MADVGDEIAPDLARLFDLGDIDKGKADPLARKGRDDDPVDRVAPRSRRDMPRLAPRPARKRPVHHEDDRWLADRRHVVPPLEPLAKHRDGKRVDLQDPGIRADKNEGKRYPLNQGRQHSDHPSFHATDRRCDVGCARASVNAR